MKQLKRVCHLHVTARSLIKSVLRVILNARLAVLDRHKAI